MRFLAALAVVGSIVATAAALAQDAPPPMRYTWDQQPDAMAFARAYPMRAQQEEMNGAAVLCCSVNEDRTLNCTAPLEWPADYGFGEASLTIARYFRMSEASYAEISGDPNHTVRRTIRWVLPDRMSEPPPEFREAARNACNGPAAPVS